MKPLISYYGGKQRMASYILPLLPPHTVYAEPFAGGAAVFWAKGRPVAGNNDHYREALNDTNKALLALYRVGVSRPGDLLAMLDATPYSMAEYEQAWQIYNDPDADELDLAWAVYVQAQMSFSNKIGAGWRRGVFSQNLAVTWENRKGRLCRQLDRLRGVHLDCVDALDFIKLWDSPYTLFYCDPPYPGAHQGHYSGYTPGDFDALVEVLDNCQGSFVLSNYDQPGVPDHWRRVEIEAVMSAANGRNRETQSRTEVLWIMDRSGNVREDIRPLLQQWTPNGWRLANELARPLRLFESIEAAGVVEPPKGE